MGNRPAQEAAGELGIPFETAGGDDHSAPGYQIFRCRHFYSDNPPVGHHKRPHAHAQPDFHPGLQARFQKTGHQRLPEAALVAPHSRRQDFASRHGRRPAQWRFRDRQGIDGADRDPLFPFAQFGIGKQPAV